MKKFLIVTLGCRTNQYESQVYREQLQALGYREGVEAEDIALCIVNTCSVTENADKSSMGEIRQLIKKYPQAKIIVTGCAVIRDREFPTMKGVSFIPNLEKERLISLLTDREEPPFKIERFQGHTRAFVKVQDGCNQFCSYCIVPFTRGRSRSRHVSDIILEVKDLIKNGFKEIVVTGIHLGDFLELPGLLKRLQDLDGLERIRLSSLDPNVLEGDLWDAVTTTPKVMPNLHLSLQSGSNVILKKMNRRYSKELFVERVQRLLQVNPDFTITTDIIVGFPGESESDFEDTLTLCQKIRFAKVHIFPYSRRKNTKAASFSDMVSCALIKERKKQLSVLVEREAFVLRDQYVGRKMKVLMEEKKMGHTENFLPVRVENTCFPNELVEVVLNKNTEKGLVGCIWK